MYIIVLIIVIVPFSNLIICAEAADSDVKESQCFNVTAASGESEERPILPVIEDITLCLAVRGIKESLLGKKACEGHCLVGNKRIIHPEVQCNIVIEQTTNYINVSINHTHIIKNVSNLDWSCTFDVKKTTKLRVYRNIHDDDEKKKNPLNIKALFRLNVTSVQSILPEQNAITLNWRYVATGVGVLVLLIIIGQAICIIHFKRKAKAVRIEENLSKPTASIDDSARYSRMPSQKKKVESSIENRESGIYEVLENVRVCQVPEPPPLKTLPPRNDAGHRSTSPTAEPTAAAASNVVRTFTNGILLPFTLKKKPPKDPDCDNKRSTIDRIKERPPMKIPSDDIYEVMESSPSPPTLRKKYPKKGAVPKNEFPKRDSKEIATKNTFPKRVVPKKEEFRGFNTQPKPSKPALHTTNVSNEANPLKPQILPSQLREALGHRNRGHIEPAPKVIPFNRGLPPPLASPPKLTAPRGPRAGGSPWAGRAPPPEPATGGPSGPAGPGVPKWRPPPPVKPKQLHPLPQPPPPESIHVSTAGGEDGNGYSSDEEWVYEPLPSISSFNIYSNT